MSSVAVTISEEVLNDGAALSAFLKREFAQGHTVIELRVMPSGARWHEEDKPIPFRWQAFGNRIARLLTMT